jgi:hypothetical protein
VSNFGWKSVSRDDRGVLDFVLRTSSEKYFGEFQRLVDSTYPVLHVGIEGASLTGPINLVSLASEYAASPLALTT